MRPCWQKDVLNQLTVETPSSVAKPGEPSLDELRRYVCKMEVASQFHRWYAISAFHMKNSVDAVIVRDHQHPFVCCSYWPRLATVDLNRNARNDMSRHDQIQENRAGKVYPASDFFGALAVYGENPTEVLRFVNFLEGLIIKNTPK